MTEQPASRNCRPARPSWGSALPILAIILALSGCAAPPKTREIRAGQEGTWAGRTIGARSAPQPALKQAMVTLATREWVYFGRQNVVYSGGEESIPHVGMWEDEDAGRIARVNEYWRAAGRPGLSGRNCQEPWSAAFMSWLMQQAGVSDYQFPSAPAHWVYLGKLIRESDIPGRYFVPRGIGAYRPQPGDIICASQEVPRTFALAGEVPSWMLENARAHCDLVVKADGRTLEAIGGNVRNSVSKSILELDGNGHLQPVPRRPWFIVLENRL